MLPFAFAGWGAFSSGSFVQPSNDTTFSSLEYICIRNNNRKTFMGKPMRIFPICDWPNLPTFIESTAGGEDVQLDLY